MEENKNGKGFIERIVLIVLFAIFIMFPIMVGIHWIQSGIDAVSSASEDYSYTVFNLVLPLLAIMAYFKKNVLIDILKDVVEIFRKFYARDDAPLSTNTEKEASFDFNEQSGFSKEHEMDIEKSNQISQDINVTQVNIDIGSQSFEYSENNGIHPIIFNNLVFITKWSKANTDCIYVYNHHPEIMESVAKAEDIISGKTFKSFEEIDDPGSNIFRSSSDFNIASLGEIVIWKNKSGDYLLTKINSIEYKGRNSEYDRVNFTCQIRQHIE